MTKYDSWDNYDEDNIPAGDDYELEHREEWEDENEECPVGYASHSGCWDIDEWEDEGGFQKIERRTQRIRSVKTYSEAQDRAKKKANIKYRNEAKAREKQRQAYYHYGSKDGE